MTGGTLIPRESRRASLPLAEAAAAAPFSDLALHKSRTLAGIVQEELERMILGGGFSVGERLNENTLAARLGVSRGPVREACRALAEIGLVELIPNRGVFIREIGDAEAAELYDVGAGLFAVAARLLAEKAPAEDLAALELLLDRMEAAAGESFDAYYPLNLEFHDLILRATGNARLLAAYRQLVKGLHLFRARGLMRGGGLEVSNAEHRLVVEAIRAGDALGAFEAAYGHVQAGKARMLKASDDLPGG